MGTNKYLVIIEIASYNNLLKWNDLSKGKRIKLFKWKSTVLLWAYYKEGLYTNWMGKLNVYANIIRMNVWTLCEYNRIMLL